RLRGRRVPAAQERAGRDRLAAAGPARRRRFARVGGRHRGVPARTAARPVRGVTAAGHDVRRAPVELGEAGREPAQPARLPGRFAVERREGPLLRAAAPGTGGRGPLRPHGRYAVPAHRTVRPLAAGPYAGVVHVRPTRAAGLLRPQRNRPGAALTARYDNGCRPWAYWNACCTTTIDQAR